MFENVEKYIASFVTSICLVWAITISQFGYIALGLLAGFVLNRLDNPKDSKFIYTVSHLPYFAMVDFADKRYDENWLV